jgi:nicotinamide-nucleotide amidase
MKNNELKHCCEVLLQKELTIAFAESATAGRVSAEFSLMQDAGQFLKGGFVCYDACLKEEALGVSPELIKKFTPESAEVTAAIAKGLEKLIRADLHVGITGLTAPGGSETAEKPVGTMFIHINMAGKTLVSERALFIGSPEEIIMQTTFHTATLLNSHLQGEQPAGTASQRPTY